MPTIILNFHNEDIMKVGTTDRLRLGCTQTFYRKFCYFQGSNKEAFFDRLIPHCDSQTCHQILMPSKSRRHLVSAGIPISGRANGLTAKSVNDHSTRDYILALIWTPLIFKNPTRFCMSIFPTSPHSPRFKHSS